MTQQEGERLAKVETKIDDARADIGDIKSDMAQINRKLDNFMNSADDKYLTVAQAKLIGWLLGFLLALLTAGITIIRLVRGG